MAMLPLVARHDNVTLLNALTLVMKGDIDAIHSI